LTHFKAFHSFGFFVTKAVELVKPNGYIVYSTCTITVEENESQVAWLLKKYPDLELVSQVKFCNSKEYLVF